MSQTAQIKATETPVAIQTIKIRIGKKEIELPIEDAKALKKVLEDLFGKEVITVDHHHYHNDGWYWPKPYWGVNTPYIYRGTSQLEGADTLNYEAKYNTNTAMLSISIDGTK